ncbi:MAG: dihydropteroate synthase [Bacteroides sp.]|nr:dihydropteroate synthase [Bacteroides sp.]MCM1391062.1 dihydropteroate synthase [Bacteroides sp.]
MHQFAPFTLNIKGRLLCCNRPQIMGIINVTPDSFYSLSRTELHDEIKTRAAEMIAAGADMIDLGGYSSRPGAKDVSAAEELSRLERGMEAIRSVSPDIPVSIDTFRAEVAHTAITRLDANMINDISGGSLDPKMEETIAELNVPYILMHMRGTPSTMGTLTDYEDVTAEVLADLGEKLNRLSLSGVNDIIIDPGFGFAKTIEQNYELLRNLNLFHILNRPVLVGISRKSMIYRPLNTSPQEALTGTIALNTLALCNGASILRVHDVKEAAETAKIVELTYPNFSL